MAVTLDQLLYGIRQVESGGNYSVVNSIGAVGAYQILKSNIPEWTKQALGYSMTWQQFRDSRAAQDKVARYKLGVFYKKYGAQGAASMWFSGQPNYNSSASDGGNTVYQYVQKVMGASGGGSVTSGGGSYSSGTSAAKPKLDLAELAEEYGLSAGLINSSKELRDKFQQAVANTWSPARFQAELKNTNWWKTQNASLRKYITLKYTDPATWTQNRKAAMYKLNQIAVSIGMGNQIRPNGTPTQLLDSAMYNSLAMGWTDERLKDWFGARVDLNGEWVGGTAGETWDKLHELTYLNGLKFSTTWMKDNTRSVIAGKSTVETLENYIRKTAAARYSGFADQINAGQNVMDLAAPYIKSLSTLLELPETDVDLFNDHIAKAMTAKPAKGDTSGSQMPLWQFENEVREDPLWRKTNNARESMMTVAHQVAKDFGLVY
jgi:hypothetical protein